jgi:hypothetical protein
MSTFYFDYNAAQSLVLWIVAVTYQYYTPDESDRKWAEERREKLKKEHHRKGLSERVTIGAWSISYMMQITSIWLFYNFYPTLDSPTAAGTWVFYSATTWILGMLLWTKFWMVAYFRYRDIPMSNHIALWAWIFSLLFAIFATLQYFYADPIVLGVWIAIIALAWLNSVWYFVAFAIGAYLSKWDMGMKMLFGGGRKHHSDKNHHHHHHHGHHGGSNGTKEIVLALSGSNAGGSAVDTYYALKTQ